MVVISGTIAYLALRRSGGGRPDSAMSRLRAEEVSRAVLLENLAAETTEADLEDFLSICGAVDGQILNIEKKEALVVFQDEEGRQAALMINGGKLHGSPVTVSPVPDDYWAENGLEDGLAADESTDTGIPVISAQELEGMDDMRRSRTAPANPNLFGPSSDWIENMKQKFLEAKKNATEVAKEMGEEAKVVSKELNNSIRGSIADANIPEKFEAAKSSASQSATQTKEKFAEIDAQYEVSEKAKRSKDAAATFSKQVDETLGITTAASNVASASRNMAREVDDNLGLSETTRRLTVQALDNETVQSTVRSFSASWSALKSKLMPEADPALGPSTASNLDDEDEGEPLFPEQVEQDRQAGTTPDSAAPVEFADSKLVLGLLICMFSENIQEPAALGVD